MMDSAKAKIRHILVQRAAPGSRAILICSTAILGVATSLIATEPTDLGNWLILFGSGIGIYVADVYGQVEGTSLNLERISKVPRATSRDNLMSRFAPRFLEFWLLTAVILVLFGLIMRIPLDNVLSFLSDQINAIRQSSEATLITPEPASNTT